MTETSRRTWPPRAARAPRSDLTLLVAAACAAAVVSMSLVGLVLVRTAAVDAGYRVHDRRAALARLRDERAALELERAMLLRPARLTEQGDKLGMAVVDPLQLVSARALMGGEP
jgi:hypothetical protein